jgi:hypothetical protein
MFAAVTVGSFGVGRVRGFFNVLDTHRFVLRCAYFWRSVGSLLAVGAYVSAHDTQRGRADDSRLVIWARVDGRYRWDRA